MTYYLVDLENASHILKQKLISFKENNTVYVYYSEHCKILPLNVFDNTKGTVNVSFFKVESGTKNALDFQLVSHLGYLINKHGENNVYQIISKDQGYDCVCKFWTDRGYNVTREGFEEPKTSVIPVSTIEKQVVNAQIKSEKAAAPQKTIVIPEKAKTSESSSGTVNNNIISPEEIDALIHNASDSAAIAKIINTSSDTTAIFNRMSGYYKSAKAAVPVFETIYPLFIEKNIMSPKQKKKLKEEELNKQNKIEKPVSKYKITKPEEIYPYTNDLKDAEAITQILNECTGIERLCNEFIKYYKSNKTGRSMYFQLGDLFYDKGIITEKQRKSLEKRCNKKKKKKK